MGSEISKSLCIGIDEMKKYRIQKSMFHKTAEELKELDKENDIKLLKLWEYLRKRKVKNDTIPK